jgi:hypothetical protein
MTSVLDISSAREEIAIPVERHSHDSIRAVECLLNTVTMMHININIEDSIVVFQKLKYSQDDIVHIAEATRLHLFGMMQTTSPINANISALVVEFYGGI